jgi:nitrogen fixation/metabolism regulation signal transduction histidine kinase
VLRDNGPGFSKEVLERAFDPYFTTKAKGTGLGLAIVKKIIEEHDGRVVLSNEETGAAIEIKFPIANRGDLNISKKVVVS